MYAELYENKKDKGQRIHIAGKLEEFEELGITPMRVWSKNGTGEMHIEADDEGMALFEVVSEWVEEHQEKVDWDSMRQLTTEFGNQVIMEYFLTWVPTSKRPFNRSDLGRCGFSPEMVKVIMPLALKDGWCDGDGKMTEFGIRESDLCLQMLEMNRDSGRKQREFPFPE